MTKTAIQTLDAMTDARDLHAWCVSHPRRRYREHFAATAARMGLDEVRAQARRTCWGPNMTLTRLMDALSTPTPVLHSPAARRARAIWRYFGTDAVPEPIARPTPIVELIAEARRLRQAPPDVIATTVRFGPWYSRHHTHELDVTAVRYRAVRDKIAKRLAERDRFIDPR